MFLLNEDAEDDYTAEAESDQSSESRLVEAHMLEHSRGLMRKPIETATAVDDNPSDEGFDEASGMREGLVKRELPREANECVVERQPKITDSKDHSPGAHESRSGNSSRRPNVEKEQKSRDYAAPPSELGCRSICFSLHWRMCADLHTCPHLCCRSHFFTREDLQRTREDFPNLPTLADSLETCQELHIDDFAGELGEKLFCCLVKKSNCEKLHFVCDRRFCEHACCKIWTVWDLDKYQPLPSKLVGFGGGFRFWESTPTLLRLYRERREGFKSRMKLHERFLQIKAENGVGDEDAVDVIAAFGKPPSVGWEQYRLALHHTIQWAEDGHTKTLRRLWRWKKIWFLGALIFVMVLVMRGRADPPKEPVHRPHVPINDTRMAFSTGPCFWIGRDPSNDAPRSNVEMLRSAWALVQTPASMEDRNRFTGREALDARFQQVMAHEEQYDSSVPVQPYLDATDQQKELDNITRLEPDSLQSFHAALKNVQHDSQVLAPLVETLIESLVGSLDSVWKRSGEAEVDAAGNKQREMKGSFEWNCRVLSSVRLIQQIRSRVWKRG